MYFTNPSVPPHQASGQTGVLLVNLGTPDSPSTRDVRRYLKEFLWDRRVVELSRPLWWLVLNLMILNTRPSRSAQAYRKIWTPEGSPLKVYSEKLVEALQNRMTQQHQDKVKTVLAMRYGTPSIKQGLESLAEQGVSRVLVLPMYPQYSATTTAAVFDAVTIELRRWRLMPELRFVNSYHDNPGYIEALAFAIEQFWGQHGRPERLVISFHGIPQDYFDAGDPYFCHCQKTARLLAERLELQKQDYLVTFQSRLGPRQWLRPYTDETLRALGAEGVKSVHVVCPGFSVDCLETLEEIAMENREVFEEAGGREYRYISCLNDDSSHVDMLATLVNSHIENWVGPLRDTRLIQQRAQTLGSSQHEQ